jgi:hypothetical protein
MALIQASGGAVCVGSDELGDIVVTPVGELDLAVAPIVLGAIAKPSRGSLGGLCSISGP